MRISDWSSDVCSSDLKARDLDDTRAGEHGNAGAARPVRREPPGPRAAHLDRGATALPAIARGVSMAPARPRLSLRQHSGPGRCTNTHGCRRMAGPIFRHWTKPLHDTTAPLLLTGDRKSTRLNSSH